MYLWASKSLKSFKKTAQKSHQMQRERSLEYAKTFFVCAQA